MESGQALPALVPELDVSNLADTLVFYCQVLGFAVVYERPEEGFAFLSREGASIMVEAAAGPGRRFRTAPLERPYGRGINVQIRVTDVAGLYRALEGRAHIKVELEEKWYRAGDRLVGNKQFVVADPDGYLLRFYEDLGSPLSE
jgi:catechol 2,3-dioxygenase-like lactoylglutathione lyase family enzyme